MGITHNRHTDLSTAILHTRWNQFQGYVEHYLQSLQDDVAVKGKLAAHAAEWEHRDKLEDMKLAFAKKAGDLNRWLQNAHGLLTMPLNAKSVADVQQAGQGMPLKQHFLNS